MQEKRPRNVTVIVPTYNEAENLPTFISRISPFINPAQVLIADDNSPDGTAEIARQLGCQVLVRTKDKGLSASVIDALRLVKTQKVIVMDADLQHPPEVIPKLVKALEKHKFAVASRYVKGGGCTEWDLDRKIISRVANLAAKPFTKVKDAVSGFFGLDVRYLPELKSLNTRGFKIMLELLAKGNWGNVAEVPYLFDVRRVGRTKMSKQQVTDYLIQLGALYLRKFPSIKFMIVGASGLLVNLFILWGLTSFGLHYLVSFIFAFLAAVANNYYWNNKWTFKDRIAGRVGFAKYLAMASVTLALDEGLLVLFTEVGGIHYVLSAFIAIVVVFVIRYLVAKRWIWSKSKQVMA